MGATSLSRPPTHCGWLRRLKKFAWNSILKRSVNVKRLTAVKSISLMAGSCRVLRLGSLGHIYASVGRRNDARNMLQSIAEQSSRTYISPCQLAIVHAGLDDDKDKAIDELEKAFAERSLSAPVLRFDPRLDNLRAEPRFQDFARGVGLSF